MDFDPYYQWLGIPPDEQPPNHYRLLGLRLFETNDEAIGHAADRQMSQLRTFQAGKNAAASQKLLNEVAAARICLLTPARKAAYDAQLQMELANPLPSAESVALPSACGFPPQYPVPSQEVSPYYGHPAPIENYVADQYAAGYAQPAPEAVPSPYATNYNYYPEQQPAYPAPQNDFNLQQPTATPIPVSYAPQPIPVMPAEEQQAVVEVNPYYVEPQAAAMRPEHSETPLIRDVEEESDGEPRKAKKRRKSAAEEVVKVIAGGLVGCVIAILFLWYGLGRDPLGIMSPPKKMASKGAAKSRPRDGMDSNSADVVGAGNQSSNQPVSASPLIRPETVAAPNTSVTTPANETPAVTTVNPRVEPKLAEKGPPQPPAANGPPPENAPAQSKPAIPTADEQQAAMRTIEDVFRISNIKAADDRKKLIRDLTDAAKTSRDKPVEQFALLRKAMELAQEMGESREVVRIIDLMAADFEIDALSAKERTLIKTLSNVRDERGMEEYLPLAKTLIEQSISDTRFDISKRLVEASYEACNTKSFGTKFRKYVFDGRKHVLKLCEQWDEYQQAQKALALTPDDPQANHVVGLWLCLQRDEWQAGLPYLAKSSQEKIRELAALEIASPTNTEARMKVAEGWYEQSRTSEDYKSMKTRAVFWYSRLLPELAGLERIKVESRLGELGQERGIYAERIILRNSATSITDERAATRCHVLLQRGGATVWQRRDLRLNYHKTLDSFTLVDLPSLAFDTIRIEITEWYKNGGALAEVEIIHDKKNLVFGRVPTTSDSFTPPSIKYRTGPDTLTDGVIPGKGPKRTFWFLPNKSPGWIEFSFKDLAE